jgi:hypothetical protein
MPRTELQICPHQKRNNIKQSNIKQIKICSTNSHPQFMEGDPSLQLLTSKAWSYP